MRPTPRRPNSFASCGRPLPKRWKRPAASIGRNGSEHRRVVSACNVKNHSWTSSWPTAGVSSTTASRACPRTTSSVPNWVRAASPASRSGPDDTAAPQEDAVAHRSRPYCVRTTDFLYLQPAKHGPRLRDMLFRAPLSEFRQSANGCAPKLITVNATPIRFVNKCNWLRA